MREAPQINPRATFFVQRPSTLYLTLLKLEQEGLIASEWGLSENNRKAKFYKLTRAGRKQIERDIKQWEETSAIMTRFLAANEE